MQIKCSNVFSSVQQCFVTHFQKFIKEVYETLRASPQWNETLLLITYDEHGGYFDHVPTPVRNVPSPDGIVGPEPFLFEFNRLGIRVPTIAVSPWIEKGTVVHGPNGSPFPSSEYEHSSIPATVKKLFNLSTPFLTKRDEWAGTFENILQIRKEPRTDCPETLPEPVKIRMTEANENAKLSEFQQELVQLAAVLKGDDVLTAYCEIMIQHDGTRRRSLKTEAWVNISVGNTLTQLEGLRKEELLKARERHVR